MDTSVQPYTVVEARIRGSEFPDEWVLLGNHRDAWAFGGVDPSSGTASMLELSRALGELKKNGMRPRRTLVICSWDGEEYALTGSTEWGEQFGDELKKKLIAYINVDSSASGPANRSGNPVPDFHADAVASLAPMIVEASHTLRVPTGETLYDVWRKTRAQEEKTKPPLADSRLVNTRIGSGSDHTVFLNHLGRPTVGLEFDGQYGVYHSMYDDHFWMEHFGDPGFKYHIVISDLWGLLALRLANADVLPLDFAAYAANIREFVNDLDHKSKVRPNVDLSPLYRKIGEFEKAGQELNAAVGTALAANTQRRGGGETEPAAHAGGIQLAHAGWHTRPAMVPAPSLCRALYLCAPGTAGPYRSRGERRLAGSQRTGGSAGGGCREKRAALAPGRDRSQAPDWRRRNAEGRKDRLLFVRQQHACARVVLTRDLDKRDYHGFFRGLGFFDHGLGDPLCHFALLLNRAALQHGDLNEWHGFLSWFTDWQLVAGLFLKSRTRRCCA